MQFCAYIIPFQMLIVFQVLFADYMAHLQVPVYHLESQNNWSEAASQSNFTFTSALNETSIVKATCLLPQYQMYTWVLAMVCLGTFLKLSYIIKSTVLLVMAIVYTILMTVVYPEVFGEIQVDVFTYFLFLIELKKGGFICISRETLSCMRRNDGLCWS